MSAAQRPDHSAEHNVGGVERPRLFAFLIALVFGVAGIAWIWGSDKVLQAMSLPQSVEDTVEVWKGSGYVVVTSIILYLLVSRPLVRLVGAQGRAVRASAEAQARAQELETVLDAVPVAVWIARDPDCRVIDGNRLGRELLGQDERVNLSMSAPSGERPAGFKVLMGGQLAAAEELPVQVAAKTGLAVRDVEEELVFEDGRRVTLLGNAVPLRSAQGELVGAVGAFLDVTGREQVLRELQRNKLILEQAQGLGQIGSWVSEHASEGGQLEWSKETCRIFGLQPEEFDERVETFFEMVHPDDREAVRRAGDEAKSGKRDYEIEHRIIRRDGAVRWVHERARIERDESGNPLRMIGVCQDITDRIQAEAVLRASEARLRTALDAAKMIGWETETGSGVTTYSQDPAEFFGLDPSAGPLSATAALDIIHPDARDEVLRTFNQTLAGTEESVESVFRSASPTAERWFRAMARIMRDPAGRPLRVIGVTQEVTSQREDAARLRKSEAMHRMIVETCHEGVWLADAAWKTSFVNDRLASMLGRTPEQMIGRSVLEFVEPDEREAMLGRLRTRQRGESGLYETRLMRSDGASIWVTMAASPVRDDAGNFSGALAMVTDITHRREAEGNLRLSEERYRTLIESAPEAIVVLDFADGRFADCNDQAVRLFGMQKAELMKIGPLTLSPERQPDGRRSTDAAADFLRQAADGLTPQFEWTHFAGNGRELQCEVRLIRLPDPERVLIRGSITDISDRKRAQQALAESEERLRIFIENSPAGVAMLDRDLKYIAYSKRWLSDYHLGEQDLTGRSHYEVFPEIEDHWKDIHRRCLATGSSERCEEDRFERADGSVDYLRWEVQPWRDSTGAVGGLVFFTEMITERKLAEVALRASEEKYRLVLRATSDALWDYEPSTGHLRWGDNVETMFGVSIHEMGDRLEGWTARLHPDDRDRVAASFDHVVAQGAERWIEEYRFRRADGSYAVVLDRAYVLRRDDGTVVRIIGAMTDITERRHNEQLMAGQAHTLELLVAGDPLEHILSELVRILEGLEPGCLGSVLLMNDDDRTVRSAAAPSLPPEYSRSLDGVAIGPGVGSCGTAMHERRRVIVSDIETDPLWAPYKQLALPHGLRACWSEPIIGAGGLVLGSLAMYYREPRGPGAQELRSIAWAARLAGLAIERRRAEEQLRKRENDLRDLLTAVPDLMFRMNKDGRYLEFNAPNPRDLFAPPEKFLGRTVAEVMPGERAERCMAALDRAIATGQPQMYEYTAQSAAATRHWEVRVTRCAEEQALLLVRDITNRRTAERRLKESEHRLSMLVKQSPLGVIVWNLDFTVAEWNRAAEQIFGWTAEQAIGRHARFIIPVPAVPHIAKIWQALRAGRGGSRSTNPNITADGREIHCEWYNSPLIDADGRVVAVVSIVDDITEQRLNEQRQQLMTAELDHRVKNNLAAVISLAEQSGRSTSTYAEFRESFLGRVRALARLHNALAATKWEGANLRNLAQQTLEAFGQDASSQAVMAGPALVLPPRVAQSMGMALNELCTNAIKYGALSVDGGRVEVRWRLVDIQPSTPTGATHRIDLEWTESGGPPVRKPERRGFGTELIEGAISYELGGRVEMHFEPTGLHCRLEVPLPRPEDLEADGLETRRIDREPA